MEDINEEFHRECVAVATHGCSDGIDGLVKRWQKCIELEGQYTE